MRSTITLLALLASAPLLAQRPDTTLYTPAPEFLFGLVNSSLKRAVSVDGAGLTHANANLRGVEFQALASGGGGLRLRYETGTLPGGSALPAAGKFETLDGRAILGTHSFSLVPGYALRTVAWNGTARRIGLAMLGAEVGQAFDGAGLHVRAGATYLRTVKDSKSDSLTTSGIEAATSLLYAPPRFPIFVQLGYRRELLSHARKASVARREETSALILSIGVQAGIPSR